MQHPATPETSTNPATERIAVDAKTSGRRRRPSGRSLGLMAAAVAAAATVGVMTTQVGAEPVYSGTTAPPPVIAAPAIAAPEVPAPAGTGVDFDAEIRFAEDLSDAGDFEGLYTQAVDWITGDDTPDRPGWVDDCPGCGMG